MPAAPCRREGGRPGLSRACNVFSPCPVRAYGARCDLAFAELRLEGPFAQALLFGSKSSLTFSCICTTWPMCVLGTLSCHGVVVAVQALREVLTTVRRKTGISRFFGGASLQAERGDSILPGRRDPVLVQRSVSRWDPSPAVVQACSGARSEAKPPS